MILDLDDSRLYRAAGMVQGVYIAENAELESLLFDRNIVGEEFGRRCLASTASFLNHFADELQTHDYSELVILSKGVCYQVLRAYEELYHRSIGVNFVATQRKKVTSDDALIDVSYLRVDAPSSNLIVADTVASGASVVAAVNAYSQLHDVSRLLILSYAGATKGAERIVEFCRSRDIEVTIVFGLASFGLADNGFDLSFLHPETVTATRYVERAARQFDSRPVSAVGWDFGSQWIAVEKYRNLCWLEATKWDMVGHPAFALAAEPATMDRVQAELSALE